MNKEEEIIKVAIEGGWKPVYWIEPYKAYRTCGLIVVSDLEGDTTIINPREAILDPKFFQSIGKAKRWTDNEKVKVWKFNAHEFYEINLSDPIKGWDDAINYLYELIK